MPITPVSTGEARKLMTTEQAWPFLIIGLILVCIALILMLFRKLRNKPIVPGIVFFCIGMTIFADSAHTIHFNYTRELNRIHEYVQEGYKIRLDEQDISMDDVKLWQYDMEIYSDSKEIILKHRE